METKSISVSTGTLIRAFIVVLFASLFLYLNQLVIMLLVAVVLASAIEPWIVWLKKYKLSRSLAVSSIFLGIISAIILVFYFLLPPLLEDIVAFVKHVPEILQKITFLGKGFGFSDVTLYFEELSKDLTPEKLMGTLRDIFVGSGSFFEASSAFLGALVNTALTFVIAFYLAVEERGVHKFLRIVIPVRHEKYVEDLWTRAQMKFSYWLRGQLLLSLIMAVLIFIPLLIIGMPYAALLSVFVFFGELVPMVGFALASLPAILVAFVSGGGSLAVMVAVIYIVINFLENHVIYPAIMNRLVGVPSVIIIIAVLIGADLAGIWGVILAVPLSAVLMELVSDLEKRRTIG